MLRGAARRQIRTKLTICELCSGGLWLRTGAMTRRKMPSGCAPDSLLDAATGRLFPAIRHQGVHRRSLESVVPTKDNTHNRLSTPGVPNNSAQRRRKPSA